MMPDLGVEILMRLEAADPAAALAVDRMLGRGAQVQWAIGPGGVPYLRLRYDGFPEAAKAAARRMLAPHRDLLARVFAEVADLAGRPPASMVGGLLRVAADPVARTVTLVLKPEAAADREAVASWAAARLGIPPQAVRVEAEAPARPAAIPASGYAPCERWPLPPEWITPSDGFPEPRYVLTSDPEKLARRAYLAGAAGICGLDTEATGLDPRRARLRLVQLALPGVPVLLFDAFGAPPGSLEPLADLLADSGTWVVMQNAKYDLKMLRAALSPEWGRHLKAARLFDTMLMEQLLAAGLPVEGGFGLEAIARRRLGLAMDKAEQSSDWSGALTAAQLGYAALDAAVLLPLAMAQSKTLAGAGLARAAWVENGCASATADMEFAGLRVDLERLGALGGRLRAERDALAERVREALRPPEALGQTTLFGGLEYAEVNLNSNPQMRAALARATGEELASTDEDTLAPLAAKHPVVADFLAYREREHNLNAFVDPVAGRVDPATGRIHADFRQINPRGVGRFSCKAPNLQQVPRGKEWRSCYRAAPGRRLVIADYSAMEMRLMAWLSGDRAMTELFRAGFDPHRATAARLLGKRTEDVTKPERQVAKSANFGIIYHISASGLVTYAKSSYGVEMTEDQAEEFIRKFLHEAYPGVAAWQERQDTEARAAGLVRTASGRLRRWPDGRMPVTELCNTPDQGSGADIAKRAMALVRERLGGFGGELVAMAHDELVLEVPEAEAEAAAAALRECMIRAWDEFVDSVPIEVEVGVGDSWAEKP